MGAADRARLRGVVPGELGLGWGTGRCKRCGLGGEAEAGEQAAGEVGIGDEGHDGATTAAGALENVLGEHPAQEFGPWQPARARHGGRATRVRRVVGGGRCGRGATWVSGVVGGGGGHERAELRASFAGGAEHAGVANQMASGRRDDADKSSEKRDGLRDEVGAAVGPRALELVRDPAVGGPGEPIVGERGPCAVAGETFERLAIVIGDHDTCVQREALGPRAEAVGAAHDVGDGGGRGAPGGDGLGLNPGLVVQYARYEPLPGVHLDGATTLGENIGDNAGLSIALEAYRISLHGQAPPVLDGFSGEQRFFLSWAQTYRENVRGEQLRKNIASDPHSPAEFRVNGVVRNMDAWYTAFGVKPGAKLYLAPRERIQIW